MPAGLPARRARARFGNRRPGRFSGQTIAAAGRITGGTTAFLGDSETGAFARLTIISARNVTGRAGTGFKHRLGYRCVCVSVGGGKGYGKQCESLKHEFKPKVDEIG